MSGKRDQLVEVLMEWVDSKEHPGQQVTINCDALHPDADGDEDTRTLEDLIREAHRETKPNARRMSGPERTEQLVCDAIDRIPGVDMGNVDHWHDNCDVGNDTIHVTIVSNERREHETGRL